MASGILKLRRPEQVQRDKIRTLRRARRSGWILVDVKIEQDRYWSDFVKEVQGNITGKCVPWYNSSVDKQGVLGIIAFELPADATWVQLKFG